MSRPIIVTEWYCSSCTTSLETAERIDADTLTCTVCYEPMYYSVIIEVIP